MLIIIAATCYAVGEYTLNHNKIPIGEMGIEATGIRQ